MAAVEKDKKKTRYRGKIKKGARKKRENYVKNGEKGLFELQIFVRPAASVYAGKKNNKGGGNNLNAQYITLVYCVCTVYATSVAKDNFDGHPVQARGLHLDPAIVSVGIWIRIMIVTADMIHNSRTEMLLFFCFK